MPFGTIEERRAYFGARRFRQCCALLLVLLALTHRPYPASLRPVMNSAKDLPPDVALMPNYAIGGAIVGLLVGALLGALVLYSTRRANPKALMDQVDEVRFMAYAALTIGTVGAIPLISGFIAGAR